MSSVFSLVKLRAFIIALETSLRSLLYLISKLRATEIPIILEISGTSVVIQFDHFILLKWESGCQTQMTRQQLEEKATNITHHRLENQKSRRRKIKNSRNIVQEQIIHIIPANSKSTARMQYIKIIGINMYCLVPIYQFKSLKLWILKS